MAEPALNHETDDEKPVVRPNLHLYRGEDENKSEEADKPDAKIIPISSAKNYKGEDGSGSLVDGVRKGEQSGGALAGGAAAAGGPEDKLGKGFSAEKAGRGSRLKQKFWGSRAKKGGVIGTVIAVAFSGFVAFDVVQAPLQFINLAQVLQHFHFGANQDDGDDRFVKLARYIKDASAGKVEKTRLSFLGNQLANRIENQLNGSGIETAYTDKFGNFDGYIIDPSNDNFNNFSNTDEIEQSLISKYNVPEKNLSVISVEGKDYVRISSEGLGFFQSRGLVNSMLEEAGYSKISSAIGARIMGARAAISWHPLSKLDTALQNALENWWKGLTKQEETGAQPKVEGEANPDTTGEDKAKAGQTTTDASGEASSANSVETAAQGVTPPVDPGDTTSITSFQNSLTFKLTGGAAAAAGVLCIARSLATQSDSIKLSQIVLPLMRMGMTAVATGNQIMSGQDINEQELGEISQQFYDPATQTSWTAAQSIEAEQGQTLSGPLPDSTLSTISKGTPFDVLLQPPIGPILSGVCSTAGQVGLIVISFLGGPLSALANLGFGSAVINPILKPILGDLAHWIAGEAVPVGTDRGAAYGYDVDYGARLAANDQAIAGGGRALSSSEEGGLQTAEASASQADFQSHSLAYRVFDPYDYRSAVARIVDSLSPSLSHNIASLFSSIFNFGHSLATLFGALDGTAHAQAAPYNYGFPEYGFSTAEMNNPAVENPYKNASTVVGMLEDPNQGPSLIQRAQKCFNVDIAQDSNGDWGVTSGNGVPSYNTINGSGQNCNDTSTSWLRVRMFILDTETMESMGCYLGQATSCVNVGFD